jgi:Uma2 family endonuclease
VLISQEEMRVECRRRLAPNSNQWETEIYGESSRIFLKSIGLEFSIADLYRGISLTEDIPSASSPT